jgi:hypothetical protein
MTTKSEKKTTPKKEKTPDASPPSEPEVPKPLDDKRSVLVELVMQQSAEIVQVEALFKSLKSRHQKVEKLINSQLKNGGGKPEKAPRASKSTECSADKACCSLTTSTAKTEVDNPA